MELTPAQLAECSSGWPPWSASRALADLAPQRSSAPLAVIDCSHFFLAPGDRLIERHAAGCVLRKHVGDDVKIPDLLRGRGGRTRPGRRYRDLGDFGNVTVLRVDLVDGMLREIVQVRHVVAMAGFHPFGLVLGHEVEAQEILGQLDVLREVPDADAPETRGRLAVLRAARCVDMVNYPGDWLLCARHQDLVLFRRFEGA